MKKIMFYELRKKGLFVERQMEISVIWDDLIMPFGFRADLIVDNKVIIELKSVEAIAAVYPKQLLTYLKLTNLKLGLLINFNEALIKNGIIRIVINFNLCAFAPLREIVLTLAYAPLRLCEK